MKWQPKDNESFIEIVDGDERIGIYKLSLWNNSTLQVCANILPEYRGSKTKGATDAFYRFIVENLSNYRKFIAFIPDCFPNVLKYAIKCGWAVEGDMKQGFLKDQTFYDVKQVGIDIDTIKEVLNG